MKRVGQFLRSVIPSDPWQLVFLVGVVLLFVSPRLPWRTSEQILAAKAFPLGLNADALLRNLQLVVAFLYPVTFAGLVARVRAPGFPPPHLPVASLEYFGLSGGPLFLCLFAPIDSCFCDQASVWKIFLASCFAALRDFIR